jgi:hypothetical protein
VARFQMTADIFHLLAGYKDKNELLDLFERFKRNLLAENSWLQNM